MLRCTGRIREYFVRQQRLLDSFLKNMKNDRLCQIEKIFSTENEHH